MRFSLMITGFIVAILSSCTSMKEPVFNGIENVKMNKMEKAKSQITLFLNCFNPNNSKATLKKADGEAWMDSTYLGHFVVDESVAIPANADFSIPVRLDVEMKNMLQHSLSAFLSDSVLITVKGKAKVGKGGFYKKIPITYEGKQKLQDLFRQ